MRTARRERNSHWTMAGGFAGGLLLLTAAGCSTRNDPGYNPYAPHGGAPALVQRVEHAFDAAADGVDNFAERADNVLDR